jgi:hypothetical protein
MQFMPVHNDTANLAIFAKNMDLMWDSLILNTDMFPLTTWVRSEKCIDRRFLLCANIIECTYTILDTIAYYEPSLYTAYCSYTTNLYSVLLY